MTADEAVAVLEPLMADVKALCDRAAALYPDRTVAGAPAFDFTHHDMRRAFLAGVNWQRKQAGNP